MKVVLREDDSGISEVIGTILILAMTVVLFSVIIVWVSSIPTPSAQTRLDVSSLLDPLYNSLGDEIAVNITLVHQGGEALDPVPTVIYITHQQGGNPPTTDIVLLHRYDPNLVSPNGLLDGNDATWNVGERWSYMSPFLRTSDTITVTIVDLVKSSVLWAHELTAPAGTRPPVFVEKWADGVPSTVTIDPVEAGREFKIYARVRDPDGDLNRSSVQANLTVFGVGSGCSGWKPMYDDGTNGDSVANDDVFTLSNACLKAPALTWDKSIVLFRASDQANSTAQTRLVLKVVEAKGTSSGGGEGPFGLYFSNEFQAYEIYEATDWDNNRWAANGTRAFVKGQTVVVVVASQYLKNLDLQNDFFLYDASILPVKPVVYGNAPYNDPVGQTTKPSSTKAFTFVEYVSGFYVYELRFGTSSADHGFDGVQLPYGHFPVDIELRANNVPPPRNRFATVDTITVTDDSGNVPEFPKIEFFKDAAHTDPSNEFLFTETMYVKITVSDTDTNVILGDVVMSDFIGGVQVWASAGVAPVSAVVVNDATSYAFSIDLSNPNRDPWIFGRNSYGFRIKEVADDNEEYALSSQVVVRGPRWNLDVFASLNEFSHPVFDEKWYATFYDNDRLWTRYVVESFQSIPGQFTPDWGGGAFLDVAFGDLDEDADLDAVVGLGVGRVFWYRNNLGTGHFWERFEVDNLGVAVSEAAIGKIDRDTDNDIVVGTSGGEIWGYSNDGRWTPTLVADLNSAINALEVADVTLDGYNDIIVGTQGGEVRIYINDGFGNFGTQQLADYTLATDIDVQGTRAGTVTNTQTSDNGYESITEVSGAGEVTTLHYATSELKPMFGRAFSGTYANTNADDGIFQVLEEEFYDGAGPNDKWWIRNSTGGATPGYQYHIGNIPALSANDTAWVTVSAYVSSGTEQMNILYKVGSTTTVTQVGSFTETAKTTKTFTLTGFTGGNLYIVVQDEDTSNNDGSSDGTKTQFAIDLIEVRVTRSSGTTSRLEHKWQSSTIGTGGQQYKIFVEAHRTINGENDNFLFQWSTAQNGPWTDLVTVSKTSDNNVYQTASLPASVGGTQIYVRVIDTNRTPDALEMDTIYIDHVFIRRFVSVPNFQTISVGVAVNDLTVGDMNADGRNDIVVGAGNNAVVYYGSTWTSFQSMAATGTVLAIDIGYIDAGTTLDIVVGTADDRIYWFKNDGTWARAQIANLGADVATLRVGDVDGDLWDDIVVGTSNGYVRWFRHDKGTSWIDYQIDKLDTQIYAIDIGDVDRGVVIDP